MESSAPNLGCWSSPASNLSENPGPKYTESLPNRTMAKISRIEDTRTDLLSSAFHLKFESDIVTEPVFDSLISSPTTTVSTLDYSLSDPLSSVSPESPPNENKLASSSNTASEREAFQATKISEFVLPRIPLTNERPMTSPSVKRKNPKSLALNLSPSIENFQKSEPSSPCFIKPPTLRGKKKPSLLSLNTGAANSSNVEPPTYSRIPSMLQRRCLKHSVSTPHMLSTPKFGPAGGMSFRTHLYPSRLRDRETETVDLDNGHTIEEEHQEFSTGVQMATRLPGVTVGGDAFDRAHSGEDAKATSYPNGPILMYEPNIYLYSEPKPEEAIEFDVIINVAREVKCPFNDIENDNRALRRSTSHSALGSASLTTVSFGTVPVKSPALNSPVEATMPTKSSTLRPIPEYIHVPWDHSTDVKDELWDLCKLIEDRERKGKKILIHCQQGASRSATLIIAYGMYINQDMGPNEAYKLAQSRSQWVNPNMSLLFSLNDFKKVIEEKKVENIRNIGGEDAKKHTNPVSSVIKLTSGDVETCSHNRSPTVLESSLSAGGKVTQDSLHTMESDLSRTSSHEIYPKNLRSEVPNLGLPRGSNNKEWKELIIPYVDAISFSLDRLPRVCNSDIESSGKLSILSQRVIDFTWGSIFSSPSTHKNETNLGRSDDEIV